MKCSSFIASILSVVAFSSLTTQAQRITTFDVPGGIDTSPLAVSTTGEVTGFYGDPATGKARGFLRHADGKILTFDVAGMNTIPSAINSAGEIAGYYCATPIAPCNSFLRERNGTISVTDIPGAFDVEATTIDEMGQIAGHWIDGSDRQLAFLWGTNGNMTIFDINDASVVEPNAMNARGEMVGFWHDAVLARGRGFLRNEHGGITYLDAPAAIPTDTTPYAINFKGEIAGIYSLKCPFPNLDNCSTSPHGLLREANGNFVSFDVPNSLSTVAVSLDARGDIIGYYENASMQIVGFLRKTNGHIMTFKAPNSETTVPSAMSSSGVATGTYFDGQGNEHGFIVPFWPAVFR